MINPNDPLTYYHDLASSIAASIFDGIEKNGIVLGQIHGCIFTKLLGAAAEFDMDDAKKSMSAIYAIRMTAQMVVDGHVSKEALEQLIEKSPNVSMVDLIRGRD